MELYLSSFEYKTFEIPKKIVSIQKTVIDNRNVLIADLENPLNGQRYGFVQDIQKLYLINRVNEQSFEKLDTFPIEVFVLIKKGTNNQPFCLNDLQNIAWASLYNNEEDAIDHKL